MTSMTPWNPRATNACRLSLVPALAVPIFLIQAAASAQPAVQAAGGKDLPPEARELALRTTDGIELGVQYFAVPEDEKSEATVVLLHDLGGSSDLLVPLAETLQRAGCAALVPDLRGHGESDIPAYAKAAAGGEQWKLLRKQDFELMAKTFGGRVRGQGDIRGDVETVRHWIKEQAPTGGVDLDKLVVVGSGLGGAVAAAWTVADAAWPPLASGRQGGHVQAVVLVDPAFTTKGFSISAALMQEPLKTKMPVLILAGSGSRDAGKVFEQLKRQRPNAWFDSRLVDPETRRNTSPAKDSDASLLYVSVDARDGRGNPLGGDSLAGLVSPDPQYRTPAMMITAFVKAVMARGR